ncbi:MAG: hypothetical protein A2600_05525 [Candidatus Lambdaproteobacteria bacterium RIFOXYD1_FULL_56_27]|uniref:Endonuclease GajA/Old nuclease/RecF-like AAA domain-containing protein n=1 Tax=Candidatus Lambdaproteobacteria bacterium RIFOXYD2_FULL_56_26 TaxID=1817773 RepID=A0A1F6GRP3_9PROT|nr:MAG: hypothetical protein A2426_10730 [Candidatus Lambdaproteobacteria bacterium RIFOXYC1_FULL_56_13]OGH00661.1 MAG: hypothetical protein A2557_03230 [Candidatus Lambdaproteobacteria bacterium RIFOXYD2_FULL_56_26]OGH07828.1 MAG: hypothetical protein A2600_05525 [Candidatus Lambdaproteobacteria bacterium RIFOXYD1_FULL_56_27]
MITAVFLRNYKCYQNINFIPISTNSKFTAYVGNNGIGKSAILEALDTFFNGAGWQPNSVTKYQGAHIAPYVAPVFLIDKGDVKPTKVQLEQLDKLSKFFWEVTEIKVNIQNPFMKAFFEHRGELLKKIKEQNKQSSDYYFFPVCKQSRW